MIDWYLQEVKQDGRGGPVFIPRPNLTYAERQRLGEWPIIAEGKTYIWRLVREPIDRHPTAPGGSEWAWW